MQNLPLTGQQPGAAAKFSLPPGWNSWEELMDEAFLEAQKALELNEVPVGAVVVAEDGKIAGRGHNSPISSQSPVAHAEIAALAQAARKLENYRLNRAFLVVTLEPCLMCAGAIVHSRLQGVVFGAYDSKTGAVVSQISALGLPFHNHKTLWMGGINEQKCGEILSSFFKRKRQMSRKI